MQPPAGAVSLVAPAFEIIRKILRVLTRYSRGSSELIPHAGKRWMSPVFDLDPANTTKAITRNERSARPTWRR
jgi:hypothetical protein